jgi:hypothetical protein
MSLQPLTCTLGIVVFTDGDPNTNNSRGRKRIYLRPAWETSVHLVYEKGYEFDASDWAWTKTDIPIASHFLLSFLAMQLPLPVSFNSSDQKLQLANLWRIREKF